MVDLSKVVREKKLEEILAKEAPTNHNTQETPVGIIVQVTVEEEKEEEGVKPPFIPIYLELYIYIYIFVTAIWLS